jgi:1,4-dihydroxy-2-naphthoyl-CoA hydrolase
MPIWKRAIDIEKINRDSKGTMSETLGITMIEVGDDFLKATMPIDHRTLQPYGIMHGGASCALAETVGSIAGNYCVDNQTHYCVGLDINTSHLRMVKSGLVTGVAKPIHLGRTTQIWEIKNFDQEHHLVSWTRLTLAVLERREK